ncbi:SIR2 family protein [Lacipirellula parvula]|nr:SIR2 family protein [Lacipirellula parvula]
MRLAMNEERAKAYAEGIGAELVRVAPLYARMSEAYIKGLDFSKVSYTDYRSLLNSAASYDDSLVDAFFDHFVRGRRPSATHQFICFVVEKLGIDLILTTNFDPLIEEALRAEGLSPTVYEVSREGSLPSPRLVRSQALSLMKLHGGTHGLRTGYDLDEPLPIAAMDTMRGCLEDRFIDGVKGGETGALVVVVGYSGSDRRVMDVISDHISRWRDSPLGDPTRVLWVTRSGSIPNQLRDAVQPLMSTGHSDNATAPKPAASVQYRDAQLFFQELYQYLSHEYAVSRTSYRALPTAPRSLERHIVEDIKNRSFKTILLSRFRIFAAVQEGRGTSTALNVNANDTDEFKSHESVWIDASDIATRAALLSRIVDDLSRTDRGIHSLHRPLMLRDVDMFEIEAIERKEMVCKERALDEASAVEEEWTHVTVDHEKLLEEEEGWESTIAVRWLARALRRSNVLLSIDSIGEFAFPRYLPLMRVSECRIDVQRSRLLNLLSRIRQESHTFGTSIVACAITPFTKASNSTGQGGSSSDTNLIRSDDPSADPSALYAMLSRICGPSLSTHVTMISDRDREEESRGETALKIVNEQLESDCPVAGLILVLASLFRRPRSRTALLVVAVTVLRQADWQDFAGGRACRDVRADGDRQLEATFGQRYFASAAMGLSVAEGCMHNDWHLLSRLEGGFYWMHASTKASIYNYFFGATNHTSEKAALSKAKAVRDLLAPQKIRLALEIARFAKEDVYDKSRDTAAFCEFVYYSVASIAWAFERAKEKEEWDIEEVEEAPETNYLGPLRALLSSLKAESDHLHSHGKVAELLCELGQAIRILRTIDSSLYNRFKDLGDLQPLHVEVRESLRDLLAHYSQMLLTAGHSRYALRYLFVELSSACSELSGNLSTFDELFITTLKLEDARPANNRRTCACHSCTMSAAHKKVAKQLIQLVRDGLSSGDAANRKTAERTLWCLVKSTVALHEPFLLAGAVENCWIKKRSKYVWINSIECRRRRRAAEKVVLNAAKGAVGRESRNGSRDMDLAGMYIKARELHLALEVHVANPRYGWLCGTPLQSKSLSSQREVVRIARDCDELGRLLGTFSSQQRARRVRSYLHTLHGVAIAYLELDGADDFVSPTRHQNSRELSGGGGDVGCFSAVEFSRARACLHQPFCPDDMTLESTAMLMDAEWRLLKWMNSRDKFLDGGVDDAAYASLTEIIRYLEQAESILARGRVESKWRVYFYYLSAAAHYQKFVLNYDAKGKSAVSLGVLEAAVSHATEGLTNSGYDSDIRLILRRLFDKIEADVVKYEIETSQWHAIRLRCGLPESSDAVRGQLDRVDWRWRPSSSRTSSQV